jgi:uncharacterized protein
MKPFRKHLAIAIDGGGIRGVIVTKALTMLEEKLGYPLHQRIELAAGTSTGAIIASGLTAGLDAKTINQIYFELGSQIFPKSLRTLLWPFFNHRYPHAPLEKVLAKYLGNQTMGDLWKSNPHRDIVITTFDIVENRTRFIKPYKTQYAQWPLAKAVLASASAPTYFPSVDGQFIDGGVGSYSNPAYLAAYEILFCLNWPAEETTLISLGTGRDPNTLRRGQADQFLPIQYIKPLLDAFLRSADDQQVDLVNKLFKNLDFRRFQIDLNQVIEMDDVSQIANLTQYGEALGKMVLGDSMDRAMNVIPEHVPPSGRPSTRKSATK